MRRIGLALVVAGATVWLAAPGATAQEVKHRPPRPLAPITPATTTGVTIVDFEFQPPAVTVEAGDTVTWTNGGGTSHTASSDDGSTFDSGILGVGQQFSFTFYDAGTFAFHCNIHSFMHGTVTVNAAPTTTEPATTEPPTSQPTGSTTPGGTSPAATTPGAAAGGTNTTTASAAATSTDPSRELANSGIPAAAMVFTGLALIVIGGSLLRTASRR